MPQTSIEQVSPTARSLFEAPAPLPPQQTATDWEALEPRGFYARHGKRLLRFLLLVACLPIAVLVALPIAAVNAVIFRSFNRILFKQLRVGYRGRVFTIYKFRTLRESTSDSFDCWCSGEDRGRVTRFGQLLRTTHLDELPQLLNILRGEMVFVGPRPEMVAIDAWARAGIPSFHERYALYPGVTGYAQVTCGYAPKDRAAYARKLWADQHYRRNVSLPLDLSILVRTVVWMVRGRGWGLAEAAGTGLPPSEPGD